MAGFDAVGADADPFRPAVVNRTYALQVGIEATLRYIVGMADIVARQGFLSAYLTHSRHCPTPKL